MIKVDRELAESRKRSRKATEYVLYENNRFGQILCVLLIILLVLMVLGGVCLEPSNDWACLGGGRIVGIVFVSISSFVCSCGWIIGFVMVELSNPNGSEDNHFWINYFVTSTFFGLMIMGMFGLMCVFSGRFCGTGGVWSGIVMSVVPAAMGTYSYAMSKVAKYADLNAPEFTVV